MENLIAKNIGVDSGMIILADAKLAEIEMPKGLATMFFIPNGLYKVSYKIDGTWKGDITGEGTVKIESGKLMVCDPCYVIGQTTSKKNYWLEFLKKIYLKEDYDKQNKEYLKEKGFTLIDSMGGDGIYEVSIQLEKVEEKVI